jgi:2-dehydropantoate 2-reductase
MKVLIVGAGAVGGFLAARLADQGEPVTVLARPARAEALRRDGLTLVEAGGTRVSRPRVATVRELDGGYDLVVLAVKSDALDGAIEDLAPAVGPDTAILPFLNGMRHVEPLVDRFGDAVLGGVLRIATQLRDDGTIAALAPLFEIELGSLGAASATGRTQAVAARLRGAGAEVHINGDIAGAMWAKWVFIASVGALTSLLRAPVGAIAALPEGVALARSILAEAAAVAAAAGHPVSKAELADDDELLTAYGSALTSSLARDLVAGRTTEVEPVLGDLVARGEEHGIAVPNLALATLALRVHNRRLHPAAAPAREAVTA